MKKILLLLLIFSCCAQSLWAQRRSATAQSRVQAPAPKSSTVNSKNTTKSKTKAEDKPSTGYMALGIGTNTNAGLIGGFSFKRALMHGNQGQKRFISLDVHNTRDYREYKYPYSYNGQSYIEGKLNYLFAVRPNYGIEFNLLKKSNDGGPALKAVLGTGPTLGVLSPYHVNISSSVRGIQSINSVPYRDIYDNKYNNPNILSVGGLLDGLGQSRIQMGWNLKAGLIFEFNTLKKNYTALELGAVMDYYFQPVEMLYLNKNRSSYTGAYVTFYLGKTK